MYKMLIRGAIKVPSFIIHFESEEIDRVYAQALEVWPLNSP